MYVDVINPIPFPLAAGIAGFSRPYSSSLVSPPGHTIFFGG
jgi:hypothetical protein